MHVAFRRGFSSEHIGQVNVADGPVDIAAVVPFAAVLSPAGRVTGLVTPFGSEAFSAEEGIDACTASALAFNTGS